MGVRFVHAADVHLGSPLEAVGARSDRLQGQLRDATYTAFERIVDLAIDEGVDFLVLAGDVYDQKNRSVRANEFLADQLGRLDDVGIPVYVIYGNHDPLGDATTYVELPPNVHEFGHEAPEAVAYPDAGTPAARIWGQSYRTESERRPMHDGFEPADDRIPTIGLLHTGLDPESDRYVPCSAASLTDIDGVDYWALGHIHQPSVYRQDPPIVHPGVPQGRHIREAGPGGCVLVDIDDGGGCALEFVPTSPVVWQEITVSVADAPDDLDTIDGIRRYIEGAAAGLGPGYDALESELGIPVRRPEWDPDAYVCRWVLSGRGDVHEFLATDEVVLDRVAAGLRDSLGTADPVVHTESVTERTSPPLPDVETFREEDRVVDEYLSLVDDLADDGEARETMRDRLDYDKQRNVWQRVENPEAVDDDRLALTDEKLDDLIERAERRVLDELAARRAD